MTTTLALDFASQQITIYFGLIILVTGIIGGPLNIIIFTTLKSFRQTTCAFFLNIASIVNVIQLSMIPLVFILVEGFYIDPRKVSWFCKFHFFSTQWTIFISYSSICLAAIDQFLSMSKYRHFSHLRLAKGSIIIASLFGLILSIFILIYYNVSNGLCTIINPTFAKYVSFFQGPVVFGFLPTVIMITFSVFTFVSARRLASRQVNIVRSRHDRQLTAMVLVRVLYHVLTNSPCIIVYIYLLNQNSTNPEQIAYIQFIYTVTVLLAFSNFAGSFYIYCCVSKRFRKQLVYVIINIWIKRWQHWMNKQKNNAIVPSLEFSSVRRATLKEVAFVENISLHQRTT